MQNESIRLSVEPMEAHLRGCWRTESNKRNQWVITRYKECLQNDVIENKKFEGGHNVVIYASSCRKLHKMRPELLSRDVFKERWLMTLKWGIYRVFS